MPAYAHPRHSRGCGASAGHPARLRERPTTSSASSPPGPCQLTHTHDSVVGVEHQPGIPPGCGNAQLPHRLRALRAHASLRTPTTQSWVWSISRASRPAAGTPNYLLGFEPSGPMPAYAHPRLSRGCGASAGHPARLRERPKRSPLAVFRPMPGRTVLQREKELPVPREQAHAGKRSQDGEPLSASSEQMPRGHPRTSGEQGTDTPDSSRHRACLLSVRIVSPSRQTASRFWPFSAVFSRERPQPAKCGRFQPRPIRLADSPDRGRMRGLKGKEFS